MQDARFDLEYEIFSLKDLAERPHDHLVDTSKNDAFERLGTSSSLSRVIADKACLLADSYERMLKERRQEMMGDDGG